MGIHRLRMMAIAAFASFLLLISDLSRLNPRTGFASDTSAAIAAQVADSSHIRDSWYTRYLSDNRAPAMRGTTLIASQPQSAHTLTVTTNIDEDNGIDEGGVSLREAIAAAASGDTILFSNSLPSNTIALTNGQLAIDKALTVDGGSNGITIDAQGNSRVLNIDDGHSPAIAVSLSGLTITGGNLSGDQNNSGGIFNAENLTLSNSKVSGNSVRYGGGGIFNYYGTLSISNSKVSGNSAIDGSGGISNYYGTLSISNSTVSGNSAIDGSGGISNYYGTLSISNRQPNQCRCLRELHARSL